MYGRIDNKVCVQVYCGQYYYSVCDRPLLLLLLFCMSIVDLFVSIEFKVIIVSLDQPITEFQSFGALIVNFQPFQMTAEQISAEVAKMPCFRKFELNVFLDVKFCKVQVNSLLSVWKSSSHYIRPRTKTKLC